MSKARYAGFWIRLVAGIIDTVILTAAAWVAELAVVGAVYSTRATAARAFDDTFTPFAMQAINLALYLLLAFPYFTWAHYRHGRTLGKWPFRIRVIRFASGASAGGPADVAGESGGGHALTLRSAAARSLGYALSYLPLGAGYLMAALHPEKRALHELLSGTVSVRVPRGTVSGATQATPAVGRAAG